MTRTRTAASALWLAMAALLSCGEAAGPSAPYREATAADPVLRKGGDPLSALPSHVVTGEVARYQAAAPDAGLPKTHDAKASLPSKVATGKAAAYVPPRRAGAPAVEEDGRQGRPATATPRSVAE